LKWMQGAIGLIHTVLRFEILGTTKEDEASSPPPVNGPIGVAAVVSPPHPPPPLPLHTTTGGGRDSGACDGDVAHRSGFGPPRIESFRCVVGILRDRRATLRRGRGRDGPASVGRLGLLVVGPHLHLGLVGAPFDVVIHLTHKVIPASRVVANLGHHLRFRPTNGPDGGVRRALIAHPEQVLRDKAGVGERSPEHFRMYLA
jgi:hypothetical protein